MNNMNIDENTMKNIKNMVDNGNISDAISNISPEMIQNFSKMLSNQGTQESAQSNTQSQSSTNQSTNTVQDNNIDLGNLDMNTIMKMSSVIGKMKDNKNDPRANLLNSLKPYLRDSKKGQLDNYMNLLNVAKIAEIMKENKITDISKVGLYGLTYKENVDDMRESPTLQMLESMERHLCGDLVKVYDPFITKDIRQFLFILNIHASLII